MSRVLALVDETRPLKDGPPYVVLDGDFDPSPLDFVERCELAAKLMALAEVIDPGDYETYQMRRWANLTGNDDA